MVYNFRNQIYWNDFKYGKALSGWIRDGDFKYGRVWIYDSSVFHILYDLKNDPTENDNVAFKYNRLVMFNPSMWHSNGDWFGTTHEDARLVQLFFFHGAD